MEDGICRWVLHQPSRWGWHQGGGLAFFLFCHQNVGKADRTLDFLNLFDIFCRRIILVVFGTRIDGNNIFVSNCGLKSMHQDKTQLIQSLPPLGGLFMLFDHMKITTWTVVAVLQHHIACDPWVLKGRQQPGLPDGQEGWNLLGQTQQLRPFGGWLGNDILNWARKSIQNDKMNLRSSIFPCLRLALFPKKTCFFGIIFRSYTRKKMTGWALDLLFTRWVEDSHPVGVRERFAWGTQEEVARAKGCGGRLLGWPIPIALSLSKGMDIGVMSS